VYDIKIDITIDRSKNLFKAYPPLKPDAIRIELESKNERIALNDPNRVTFAYEIRSDSDLDCVCLANDKIPIDIVKRELSNSRHCFSLGMMLIFVDSSEETLSKYQGPEYFPGNRTSGEQIYYRRSKELGLSRLIIHNCPAVDDSWRLNYVHWFKEQDIYTQDGYHIYRSKNQPRRDNSDHYRLFVDEALLIERVMIPEVDFSRKIWQECVVLRDLQPSSTLRLETDLSLMMERVSLNGKVIYPSSKTARLDF
jgi:hypothetical protein